MLIPLSFKIARSWGDGTFDLVALIVGRADQIASFQVRIKYNPWRFAVQALFWRVSLAVLCIDNFTKPRRHDLE